MRGASLTRGLGSFMYATILMMVLIAFLFALLKWLNVPSGSVLDWIFGITTAFWLLAITITPWNVYFESLAVEDEAANSRVVGIAIDETKLKYVIKLKKIALCVAISLHLISSAVLFYLSAAHITPVGYYGSAAAALLTFLRPSLRAYEYLWQRLREIRQSFKFPREDVLLLRTRIDTLEMSLSNVSHNLDPLNCAGLPQDMKRNLGNLRSDVEQLAKNYTKFVQDNRAEHEILQREGQNAIAKLSSDSQFLDHVREIVRMIKTA